METNHDHIKLTASELSYLWTSYLADSMAVCVLQYFLVQRIINNQICTLALRNGNAVITNPSINHKIELKHH